MKLLILGGGSAQLSSIKKAKAKGYKVIVSDYYQNAPGKKIADRGELVSTFDIEGNIKIASKYDIDGIMTVGTDQPVYTAAEVASKFGLPAFITPKTAKAVTNKKIMKKTFSNNKIPTVNYKFIDKDFENDEIESLKFPVVVKPLDSQGQRGIFKLNSITEVRNYFSDVIKYSREKQILIEEFYDSDEITVSAWVDDYQLHLLTITDRITYENSKHIGICTAHVFPSKYLSKCYQELQEISQKIIEGFKIKNGPIYFQMLIGEQGIKVNEIACRVGGAYEGDFMSQLTGVDILEMVIDSSLGLNINKANLNHYQIQDNSKWLSVQLFFARPGKIKSLSKLDQIIKSPEVLKIAFNFEPGDRIADIENATERAGYFITIADSKIKLKNNINKVFDKLKIENIEGENLIMHNLGKIK